MEEQLLDNGVNRTTEAQIPRSCWWPLHITSVADIISCQAAEVFDESQHVTESATSLIVHAAREADAYSRLHLLHNRPRDMQ